jgi:hypothetical protein
MKRSGKLFRTSRRFRAMEFSEWAVENPEMASTAVYETDLVAEVLAKHWQICEPAVRTDLGVSRITWRIGQRYWLSQSQERRPTELIRQAQLVQHLRCFLEDEHLSISVPEIVASESGRLVVTDGGYGWCLTRHLQGSHPDSSDPGIYSISGFFAK